MGRLDFYRVVSQCDPDKKNMTAEVLEGEAAGEKAVFSDGSLVWESRQGGFFTENQEQFGRLLTGEGGLRKTEEIRGYRIFCDWLGQEMHLVICGGGHVSIPVIKIGLMMGCRVTVLEDRPLFADHARQAGATEVLCDSFERGLDRIQGGSDTYFVIVTRGHRFDQVCLEKIVRKSHAYIGMIGSRRRVAAVKEKVAEDGGDPAVLERLYSPIGLDIGAETPEEIGVAIMAEIIEVKNRIRRTCGYSGELLREILDPEREEEEQERRVLATIVMRKGSAPREVGTRMLILPDGRCVGTIGGGCMEADVVRRALHMIRSGGEERRMCRVDMTGEEAEEEGMVCGGVTDVFLEVI